MIFRPEIEHASASECWSRWKRKSYTRSWVFLLLLFLVSIGSLAVVRGSHSDVRLLDDSWSREDYLWEEVGLVWTPSPIPPVIHSSMHSPPGTGETATLITQRAHTTTQASGGFSTSELDVLYDLYEATQGVQWRWRSAEFGREWDFSQPDTHIDPCAQHWQGLVCDESNSTVLSLSLPRYRLNGTLPSSWRNLTNLQSLDLSSNFLSGPVTAEDSLCALPLLQALSLGNNSLTGTLPACLLCGLPQLRSLNVSQNFLYGEIPNLPPSASLPASSLVRLSLSFNLLSGPLPPSLSALSKLELLAISRNSLTGPITPVFSLSSLRFIVLGSNLLTGAIPSFVNSNTTGGGEEVLYLLPRLRALQVQRNFLSSSLPASATPPGIAALTLHHNLFTSSLPYQLHDNAVNLSVLFIDQNAFSGSLECVFGESWQRISQITLYANAFSGSLPYALSRFSSLALFLAQSNLFSGSPAQGFNASSQPALQVVDLSSNPFTGSLPRSLFSPSLRSFSAFRCCFTGSLPAEICTSRELRALALDGLSSFCATPLWGQLTPPHTSKTPKSAPGVAGGIPACVWRNLPKLAFLHLSGNGLTGSLPSSLSLSTQSHNNSTSDCAQYNATDCGILCSLVSLDLSFNRLTGSIPLDLQRAPSLIALDLRSNRLTGEISGLQGFFDKPNVTLFSRFSLPETDQDQSVSLSGTLSHTTQSPQTLHRSPAHNNIRRMHSHMNPVTSSATTLSPTSSRNSEEVREIVSSNQFSLSLSTNRFSGKIPHSLSTGAHMDILTGNLFACADKQGLTASLTSTASGMPPSDDGKEGYVCGSQLLDVSLQVLGVSLFVTLFVCVLLMGIVRGFVLRRESESEKESERESCESEGVCENGDAHTPHLTLSQHGTSSWERISVCVRRERERVRASFSLLSNCDALEREVFTHRRCVAALRERERATEGSGNASVKERVSVRLSLWRESLCERAATILWWRSCTQRLLRSEALKHIAHHSHSDNNTDTDTDTQDLSEEEYRLNRALPHLLQFLESLRLLRRIALALCAFILLGGLTLYFALRFTAHSTYTHQFRWRASALFMTGSFPAICAILFWAALLTTICFVFDRYIPLTIVEDQTHSTVLNNTREDQHSEDSSERNVTQSDAQGGDDNRSISTSTHVTRSTLSQSPSTIFSRSTSVSSKAARQVAENVRFSAWYLLQRVSGSSMYFSLLALALNTAVVLVFKALFVYLLLFSTSSGSQKLLVEATLSALDVFWDAFCVPFLITSLPHKKATSRLLLKASMLFFNGIIAPSVAIAFVSPSCFHYIFASPPPQPRIHSLYIDCDAYLDDAQCTRIENIVSANEYTPLFFYNYNCYSTILSEYVPIFFLSFVGLSFLTPLLAICVSVLSDEARERVRGWKFLPTIYFVTERSAAKERDTEGETEDDEETSEEVEEEWQRVERERPFTMPHTLSHITQNPLQTLSHTQSLSHSQPHTDTASQKHTPSRPRSSVCVCCAVKQKKVFYADFLLSSLTHGVAVMLTVGLLCPPLCVAVALCMCARALTWETLLGRWLVKDRERLREEVRRQRLRETERERASDGACDSECEDVCESGSESEWQRASLSLVDIDTASAHARSLSVNSLSVTNALHLTHSRNHSTEVASLTHARTLSQSHSRTHSHARTHSAAMEEFSLYSFHNSAPRNNSSAPENMDSRVIDKSSKNANNVSLHNNSSNKDKKDGNMYDDAQKQRQSIESSEIVVIGGHARHLERLCRDAGCGPRRCVGVLCYGSALFVGCVVLDIAGDAVGWRRALWAPFTCLGVATALIVWLKSDVTNKRHRSERNAQRNRHFAFALAAWRSQSANTASEGVEMQSWNK